MELVKQFLNLISHIVSSPRTNVIMDFIQYQYLFVHLDVIAFVRKIWGKLQ